MLRAHYFDGRSTRLRDVGLSLVNEDLAIVGEDIDVRVPFARIAVDERLGRAPRRLRLPDGAFCEVRDLNALDALLASAQHRDGWVDRMQRRFRFVVVALAACIVLAGVGYHWALPWAAARGARHPPPVIGRTLSAQTLDLLDKGLLQPSRLAAERQRALRGKYAALRVMHGGAPPSALLFRGSSQLGANAFTLPDGTIIVLDELVTALGDDRQVLAVIAHELGHADGRHGLQMLLQSSAVGAFWALYFGDVSALLAAAPAAVVQASYSQDLERQADDYGAALLMRNGMSPALLAKALGTLAKSHPGSTGAGYLSSHPSTDERMQHLSALVATDEHRDADAVE